MKYSHLNTLRTAGFTLVEMAIVLMIVGLLLGGMLIPLSAQMEQRNLTETRKTLDEIQQALIGYAIINGRLPCPADGTTPTGGTNAASIPAGQEYFDTANGACAAAIITNSNAWGVLPWATLGVSETDAWGRRFTYHVTTDFADAISKNTFTTGCTPTVTPTQSSFALCSTGSLNVLTAASSGTNLASNIPAVIVSHGKNGYGAYTQTGTALSASTDLDEGDNYDLDVHFVSKSPTPTFDDQVVWISPTILFNRMVTAGKLP